MWLMRTPALSLLAAGACGVLSAAAAVLGCPAPTPPEAVRTIPLEPCYATFGGSGCQFIFHGGDKPYAFDLGELFRNHQAGASNVALVRGKDITEAVKATRLTFTGALRADTPARPDSGETKAEPL